MVHGTNRVGTMNVPGGASQMWCMSKDFRVHTTYGTKREYQWKLVIWLPSLNLHPKNSKLGKSGIFRSLEIA